MILFFFFFKQKTAYEVRISDWSSDVCSSDLMCLLNHGRVVQTGAPHAILTRPATIEAARLVDLKNLFDGEVLDHKDGVTRIGWAGHVLIAAPARPDPTGSASSRERVCPYV